MADFKFDGKELRDRRGSKIGVYDGKCFRDARGSKVGEFDGIKIFRDSRGSTVAEFDGKVIRVRGSKIATFDDVEKAIDGITGAARVGMWLFFVR